MKAINGRQFYSKIVFALLLALVIVINLLYLYNLIRWRNYPDFGFGWRTATGVKFVGQLTENGRAAGLELGDRFVEVNAETFTNIAEFRALMRRKLGEKNTYLIERKGRTFAVTIKNVPSGFKRAFKISGLPYVVGLFYALIGTLVFLMKPHRRASWIFFLYASIFGMFLTFFRQLSTLTPFWLENLIIFAYCFTPTVFIHLAFSFPEERGLLKKHPYIQLFPYLISAVLFVLIRKATPVMASAPRILTIVAVAYMAIGVLFFLVSNLQLRITSSSEIVKLRARMILLGFAIATSLPLTDFVLNALFKVYLVEGVNYYLPFLIAIPSFIGYSIVKHDLFDIDTIIKRTYGYLLTTGALAGIYGIFVLISNLAFGGYGFAKSPVFPIVFILAVVFLFNPIRNRVQRFIDRIFYRLEYDYQETVQKIGETMRSLLNLDAIGKNLMNFALQPMFVDFGSVMLLDPDKKTYNCLIQEGNREDRKASPGSEGIVTNEGFEEKDERAAVEAESKDLEIIEFVLPSDDPLITKMSEQKKEVTIYDIQEDPVFEGERESCKMIFDRLGATLIVPLIYEDQLTGLISLGRKKSGKFYRREDINLLKTLANQGAVAIENARMVEEVVEKERMEEELNIARDLQVSMLPADTPQVAGFEIAAYSMSAREVGGDFYDFINMGENKAGMIIGDVTGKSVSGALVMSASRTLFRTLSEEELSVKDSMMRANRRLKKDVKSGMFVALLYVVIDSQDKILTLCSAGQTQPVHITAGSGAAVLVETKGDTFPLGIIEDAAYEETQLKLEAGDKIILYTDGIVEAMNEEEEIFGFDRLLEVVKNSQTMTAETLLNEVKIKVNEFAGSAPQHDDITIIVIQAI